jgi:hypothetical protein
VDALNLQNLLIDKLDPNVALQKAGLLSELPGAINLADYQARLNELLENLNSLPHGESHAAAYEDIVGDIIRLCFFRSLTNVEPKVRDVEGRVIRDWVAANRSTSGFWEMVRQRYQATQVIWECKNMADLDSDAFQQCEYYMTPEIGRFIVLCFRGKVKDHYYEHVKRIARKNDGGVILILTDQDLKVFIRQAMHGKLKEDHIQDIYDRTVRQIS